MMTSRNVRFADLPRTVRVLAYVYAAAFWVAAAAGVAYLAYHPARPDLPHVTSQCSRAMAGELARTDGRHWFVVRCAVSGGVWAWVAAPEARK